MGTSFDIGLLRRMRGLFRLAEAAAEAEAAKLDVWQLAVPIDVLRNHSGLANADIRLLVRQGLVEHRLETTRCGASRRTFRRNGSLNPAARACFILTSSGNRLAKRLLKLIADADSPDRVKPRWDAASGEWTLRGALVKRLRWSAHAQRAVLDQCELQGWAEEINNPISDAPAAKRCHQLGQVLAHLNGGQLEARVHFASIKKGRMFTWKEGK